MWSSRLHLFCGWHFDWCINIGDIPGVADQPVDTARQVALPAAGGGIVVAALRELASAVWAEALLIPEHTCVCETVSKFDELLQLATAIVAEFPGHWRWFIVGIVINIVLDVAIVCRKAWWRWLRSLEKRL